MYHRGPFTPRGDVPRGYGPLARLDPHTPPESAPAMDPAGRTVLYVGEDLATSACEVFGETGEALLCPAYRVALLRPTRQRILYDLSAPGSAMAIGALPSLANGDYPRGLTQAWARAVYEDDPTGRHVDGIRYRSAYNDGLALALWDSMGTVTVVRDGRNVEQDFPLAHGPVLDRLAVAMRPRHVTLALVAAGDCPLCRDVLPTGTAPAT